MFLKIFLPEIFFVNTGKNKILYKMLFIGIMQHYEKL